MEALPVWGKILRYIIHRSLKCLFSQKKLKMHQHRWIEFLENYDCIVNYHPGRSNIVVHAWSKKVKVARLMIKEWELLKCVYEWGPKLTLRRQLFCCPIIFVVIN